MRIQEARRKAKGLRGGRKNKTEEEDRPKEKQTYSQKPLHTRYLNYSDVKGPMRICCEKTIGQMPGWEINDDKDNKQDDVYICMTMGQVQRRIDMMGGHGYVSRFPGMHTLCEKVHFTRAMNFAMSLMPAVEDKASKEMDFWPQTWVLPDDMETGEIQSAMTHALEQFSKGKVELKPVNERCHKQRVVVDVLLCLTPFAHLHACTAPRHGGASYVQMRKTNPSLDRPAHERPTG